MKISRLTPEGITAFTDFLDNISTINVEATQNEILNSQSSIEVIGDIECVHIDEFPSSKVKVAEYLHNLTIHADLFSPEKDVGLWCWLYLVYFEKLCKKDKENNYKREELFKAILDPANYLKYYRHKLAGPYYVYKTYKDKLDVAMSILAGDINTPGEVYEQLASRQEIVSNSSIVELATYLYYDKKNNKLKTGAASKNAGSSRRLATVFNQFSRTWDLYGMHSKDISKLLPKEFNKFVT